MLNLAASVTSGQVRRKSELDFLSSLVYLVVFPSEADHVTCPRIADVTQPGNLGIV